MVAHDIFTAGYGVIIANKFIKEGVMEGVSLKSLILERFSEWIAA